MPLEICIICSWDCWGTQSSQLSHWCWRILGSTAGALDLYLLFLRGDDGGCSRFDLLRGNYYQDTSCKEIRGRVYSNQSDILHKRYELCWKRNRVGRECKCIVRGREIWNPKWLRKNGYTWTLCAFHWSSIWLFNSKNLNLFDHHTGLFRILHKNNVNYILARVQTNKKVIFSICYPTDYIQC